MDFEHHVGSIAIALMDRFFDADENVLAAAHTSLTQLNKRIPPETLSQDMKQIRTALTAAISREKYNKNVTSLDPTTQQYVVPGFCRKKGLAPILPVFLYGKWWGRVGTHSSSGSGV